MVLKRCYLGREQAVEKRMIKLGKMTDYAVVIMAQLSLGDSAVPRSAAHLSAQTGIPEPTVAKILKGLGKEGLLTSVRGVAGGYHLARPAEEISVAEIITAMEGPVTIVSCVEGSDTSCRSEMQCPVRGNWDKVNQRIREALDTVRLTDMASAPCRKPAEFIQIQDTRQDVGNQ